MNNGTFYLSGTVLSRQMKRLPSFIKHDETETDKLVFPLGDLKRVMLPDKKDPSHTSHSHFLAISLKNNFSK